MLGPASIVWADANRGFWWRQTPLVESASTGGRRPARNARLRASVDPAARRPAWTRTEDKGPPEVGPPAFAQVPRDTTPPAPPQGMAVTAPSLARGQVGYDVRWHNLADAGSPLRSAHYDVRDTAGHVVVPETAVGSPSLDSIANLQTPPQAGVYLLRLWLTDEEGNVGAAASVPLSYGCIRSDSQGGTTLSAGVGRHGAAANILKQGSSTTLTGTLAGPLGGTVGAPLCVFSSVATGGIPEFLGLAITGPGGGYRFPLPAGPSRNLRVVYRPGQRELTAAATAYTRVRPTFKVRRHVVHNGRFARFVGAIPGPNNDNVTVVLQVKSGKGWRAFRRYRTRANGRFVMRYRFTQTRNPTTYAMRVQVRRTVGYPFLQGNSRTRRLPRVAVACRRSRGLPRDRLPLPYSSTNKFFVTLFLLRQVPVKASLSPLTLPSRFLNGQSISLIQERECAGGQSRTAAQDGRATMRKAR
jgi:hypothetical protein